MSFLSQLNSFQHLQYLSSELLDGHTAANFVHKWSRYRGMVLLGKVHDGHKSSGLQIPPKAAWSSFCPMFPHHITYFLSRCGMVVNEWERKNWATWRKRFSAISTHCIDRSSGSMKLSALDIAMNTSSLTLSGTPCTHIFICKPLLLFQATLIKRD